MIPAPIRVLLVEDNPGDARMLREILRDDVAEQFELIWVANLAEAVAGLADAKIDLILLDLSLPDASGLETLTRMQQAAHDVPIIVLTGQSDVALGLVALRAGAQDYLLKQNLDSHLLSRVLLNAIDHKRASQVQRASEERFHALVQHSTDIITILAADGTVLYESPSLETVMGYKPDAVNGLNMRQFIHRDDLPGLLEQLANSRNQVGMTFSTEFRVRHADGSWRTLEATLTNLLAHPAIQGIVVNSRDVTDRRRTEAEVVKQANLLDQVSDSIIALDPQGRIEFWNRGSETLYGWSAAEVTGKPLAEVIETQVVNDTLEHALHAVLARGAWAGEYLQTRKDGTRVPVLNATTLLRDAAGHPVGFVGINRDMTERQRAERALRQYNQRLELLHGIDRGILTGQAPQGIIGMIAQALTELIPFDALRIIAINPDDHGLTYLGAEPPASQESQDLLRQAVATYGFPRSFQQGELLRIDDVATHQDFWPGFEAVLTRGNARAWIIVPLLVGAQLMGGIAIGASRPNAFSPEQVEIAREIADQLAIALHKHHLDQQIQEHTRTLEARVRERTEQLRAAKERSEAILMNASDAKIVAQPTGSIEQVNTAFCRLFGYSLDQGRTLSLFALLDAASAAQVGAILDQLVVGTPAKRIELVGVRQDGTQFDADAAFTRVADGPTTILICSLRDITLRKAQERQLRYAASLQETVTDAVIASDLNFRIQSWNPAAERIYGWTAAEVLGRPVGEILLTEFGSEASGERMQQDFLEQGSWTGEVVQRHQDGHPLHILSSTVLFKDQGGQPFGMVAVNHDISLRIQAENELRQALAKEKHLNEMKTRFVSMVAHDFRTPLASIQSSSDLLHSYSQRMSDAKKAKHFETIQLQIRHLTDLLEDTLTLTKAETVGMDFHTVETDLELFCQALVDEMQPLAGTRTLQFVVAGALDWVRLDPQLLRRALVNVLSNAIKYSPEGSTVTFSLAFGAAQIELRVQDEGMGIPEADQAHLFEVFHRASNVGDIPGTGLGLSIVKLAVEAHGGTLMVESQVGVGSTFTMLLPILPTEALRK